MLATICQIVVATQALVCIQPMPEAQAAKLLDRMIDEHAALPFDGHLDSKRGLSYPFFVGQDDERWPEALASMPKIAPPAKEI